MPKSVAERKRLSRSKAQSKSLSLLENERSKLKYLKKRNVISDRRLMDQSYDQNFRQKNADRVAKSRKLKREREVSMSQVAGEEDCQLASQEDGQLADQEDCHLAGQGDCRLAVQENSQPSILENMEAEQQLQETPARVILVGKRKLRNQVQNSSALARVTFQPSPELEESQKISKSRQEVLGQKRRRETLRDKNEVIRDLEKELNKVEEENLILVRETLENKRLLEKLDEEKRNSYDWFKVVWKYISSGVKSEIKSTLIEVKEQLPKGTLRGLRDGIGINFSKPITADIATRGSDELRAKIEEFCQENSFEMPDKKHANKTVRYMRHWKTVLHGKFLSENPSIECHYSTFCSYFPKNIKKPGRDYKGSCLCEDCENYNLKDEAMKREVKVGLDLSDVEATIKAAREGNRDPEERYLAALEEVKNGTENDRIISFLEWRYKKDNIEDKHGTEKERKTLQRESVKVTIGTLASRMISSYKTLKEHLDRDFTMRTYTRLMRQRAMESSSMACMIVDWSENGVLVHPGEVQSAYFSRPTYSIHSGYCYRLDNIEIVDLLHLIYLIGRMIATGLLW